MDKYIANSIFNREVITKIYKELEKLDIKKTKWILKWGIKCLDLNRENSNGQETLKQIFNILGHQINANQNYFKI